MSKILATTGTMLSSHTLTIALLNTAFMTALLLSLYSYLRTR
ncbi:MAG: hypothetical protein ACPG4T_20650 [Nannocystaceae bacterium]